MLANALVPISSHTRSICSNGNTLTLLVLKPKDSGETHSTPWYLIPSLRWRHNDRDGVSNHQPHNCLLNRLFRHRSKKTSKVRVTGLCVGNSPGPVNSPNKWPVTRKCFHLMTSSCWPRASLDPPQPWYRICEKKKTLSSTRRKFNFLCLTNFGKWIDMHKICSKNQIHHTKG